ncbi:carbon-nitrogen hydrolase family protein [Paenibacillus lutrae]|uniref:Carbon-nitrogen hydrolase family protein n=1 Tax=Paenibacillus lutrae TaxID=2078573 RepID=A0A7X3FEU1_9BACL|nr:carbon-nitrogen hydrolase family protein [Paenibacillus lutrae]MVO98307.1 carbon-nitrogen hydrolase family protein [Paenibacillus lutrae]
MKEKNHIKIALVQMNCEKGEIDRNLHLMEEYIVAGQEQGVDIVCFPEMNITGYINPFQLPQAVLTLDHRAIHQVVKYSELYSMCVVAGFVEHNPMGKPFINQFIAHNGKLLGFYRKITIKDEEADWFAPGDQQPVFSVLGVTVGLSVCADIDDPNIFNEYADQGASIVLESAAPGLYGEQESRNWLSGFNWWRSNCMEKLGRYAAEESLYIGVSTQAGSTIDEDFPGGGYLFNPRGECTAESGEWMEGVLYVQIPI